MIVKNEEQKLARCLSSVKDLVSQIVVVDTGSSDRTIEIAKEFGAEIYEIVWPNAFDEARNEALNHSTGDWVLSLDADEWIEPESCEAIRKDIQNPNAAGIYLILRDFDLQGKFSESISLRLWRNHPEVRFRGILHERILPETLLPATGLTEIPVSEARFCHDGYAEPATKEKELSQIAMIKRELEIRPNQMYYLAILVSLEFKHELPEAPGRLRRIVQMCLDVENQTAPPDPEVLLPLSIQLLRIPAAEWNASRTTRIVNICQKWFAESPIMRFALAEFEKKRGNLNGVHSHLCQMAVMSTSGKYSRQRPFDPKILGSWLWSNLCVTSAKLGRKDLLAEAAKNWLAEDPDSEEAKSILEKL